MTIDKRVNEFAAAAAWKRQEYIEACERYGLEPDVVHAGGKRITFGPGVGTRVNAVIKNARKA